MNHQFKQNKYDEYYTPKYAVNPILEFKPTETTIWCPFDTDKSLFVKLLKDEGHTVIYTHISNNQDFFKINVECDYIISNPPYSLKNEVFERLFEIGKPFAMLVGVVGLFESKKRFDMFKNNKFEIRNAVIEKAVISKDDGFLCIWLFLDYGGIQQGFGGWVTYCPKQNYDAAGFYIMRIMEVVGVDDWKDLEGKTIRVNCSRTKVKKIGHIVKNDWFEPEKDLPKI